MFEEVDIMQSEGQILFGYSWTPSEGMVGRYYGEFSIDISLNGILFYKTYVFPHEERFSEEIKIPENTINEIKDILRNNYSNIEMLDEYIENGSRDGMGNKFFFGGKKIITWNIDRRNEEEIMSRNPNYYERYKKVIQQENSILDIFEQIVSVLRKEGIKLELYEVSFK